MYSAYPFGGFTYSGRRLMLHPQLSRWLTNAAQGDRVVELGCGAGDWIRAALVAGVAPQRLIGLDLAHGALIELSREHSNLVEGDACQLPIASNSFSHVLLYGVAHHTQSPLIAVREAIRIARPSGIVCIAVYHWGMPLPWIFHRACTPFRSRFWKNRRRKPLVSMQVKNSSDALHRSGSLGLRTLKRQLMDQAMTPCLHMTKSSELEDLFKANGCTILECGWAAFGTLLVYRLRLCD